MAFYFVSDVHLRLDRPERARKFARWVDSISQDDTIVVVGDLCDFWFASRQHPGDPRRCAGLAALIGHRENGGHVRILLGNHDATLGPYYRDTLGAEWIAGISTRIDAHGQRIRIEHGHLAGARNPLKGLMETRGFRRAFGVLPEFAARGLESALDHSNDVHRQTSDARHLKNFRSIADREKGSADLVVFGHAHVVLDEQLASSRLLILGDWLRGESMLRVDDRGAVLIADRPVLTSSH